jgi:hypothetical protein
MYADDTKLLTDVSSPAGAINLQEDLDRITTWSRDWLIQLNTAKCKVMHIGSNNLKSDYKFKDSAYSLETTSLEKDLGIYLSNNLKWSGHCDKLAVRANRMLGMFQRTFSSRDPMLWKQLYIAYIRPILDYAVPVWSPYLKQDIETIEKVQRRFTHIPQIPGNLDYAGRCKFLGLSSLEVRRTRGDLIERFKIEKGIERIKWYVEPICVDGRCDRRKQYRREIIRNCEQRHNFFTNRTTNVWNTIPENIATAESTNTFKAKLDNLRSLPELRLFN